MKKNGFIFIETIVVLVVAMVAMLSIYSTYSVTTKNAEKKEKYDNINDVYKLNAVSVLFSDLETEESYVIVDSSNCSTYMDSGCDDVFDNLNIEQMILTGDDVGTILEDNPTDIPNEVKEYMQTLDKNKPMLIIYIEENNENHYASLKIDEIVVEGSSSTSTVYVFDYDDETQNFDTPQDGTYLLEAWGAQGGNSGGTGGYVRATVTLTASEDLTINTGGINGYNGGGASAGTGSYPGGGSTIIKLGTTNLVIAAGGGAKGADGTAGGVGGTGNSAGGVTAGAGTGNAGTNGGGGSSSPNYTYQYCSYCNVSYSNCTTVSDSTSYSSTCGTSCASDMWIGCAVSGTFVKSAGCITTGCTSGKQKQGTRTIVCSCTSGTTTSSSCGGGYISCITWTPTTTYGKPGNGGTSSTGTGATLNIKLGGVNSSNGHARISLIQ